MNWLVFLFVQITGTTNESTHTIDAYNSLRFIGLGSIDDFSVVAPETFDAEQQSTIEQVPIIQQQTIPWGVGYENSRTEMVECEPQ